MRSLILACFLMILPQLSDAKTFHYTYGGNFKADIQIPKKLRPHNPVIIYCYDEFYDWAGKKLAKESGYDLQAFSDLFVSKGFTTIVPLEKYRKEAAIKGAIQHTLSTLNTEEIYIVGQGEGAFLALLALRDFPQVKKIVLITPRELNSSGHGSFPSLMRNMDRINPEVFLLAATNESRWLSKSTYLMYKVLKQEKKDYIYRPYQVKSKWFFDPEHYYMKDIFTFLEQ